MKRSPHLLVFLLIIGCGRVANLNAGDAAGLDLGLGSGWGEAFGCDLTEEYVIENSEYTT